MIKKVEKELRKEVLVNRNINRSMASDNSIENRSQTGMELKKVNILISFFDEFVSIRPDSNFIITSNMVSKLLMDNLEIEDYKSGKIIDPCVKSGMVLLEAYRRIIERFGENSSEAENFRENVTAIPVSDKAFSAIEKVYKSLGWNEENILYAPSISGLSEEAKSSLAVDNAYQIASRVSEHFRKLHLTKTGLVNIFNAYKKELEDNKSDGTSKKIRKDALIDKLIDKMGFNSYSPFDSWVSEKLGIGTMNVESARVELEKILEEKFGTLDELLSVLNERESSSFKFDTVVGNPPYQDDSRGGGSAAAPIYQYFIDVSLKISENVCLIVKDNWARSVFDEVNQLHQWRIETLKNKRLKEVIFLKDVFKPITNVSTTIAVFDKDSKKNTLIIDGGAVEYPVGSLSPIFTNKISKIFAKIDKDMKESVQENIYTYGRDSLGYNRAELRAIKEKEASSGKVEFIDLEHRPNFYGNPTLNNKGKDILDSEYKFGFHITRPWKVATEKRIFKMGKGQLPAEVLLVIPFNSESEYEAYKKYTETTFWLFLTLLSTTDVSAPHGHLYFVPWQNFSKSSEIDWEDSVEEVEKQLKKKYGITEEEFEYMQSFNADMLK